MEITPRTTKNAIAHKPTVIFRSGLSLRLLLIIAPIAGGGVLANCALGGLQLFHPFLVLCQHFTGGDDVDMVDVAVAKYGGLSVFQQVRDAHL